MMTAAGDRLRSPDGNEPADFVAAELALDQGPALLRDPFASALQILLEPLLGGGGNVDFAE